MDWRRVGEELREGWERRRVGLEGERRRGVEEEGRLGGEERRGGEERMRGRVGEEG